MDICPLCSSAHTQTVFESNLRTSIRSNTTWVHRGVTVCGCNSCGHLFKPVKQVGTFGDYQQYEAMENCPDQDKLDFSKTEACSRSSIFLKYLKDIGVYQSGTKVLDFGCHRGAFLKLLEKGEHAGFDVSETYRKNIESMGYEYFSSGQAIPKGRYDIATLIHVLEHLCDIEVDSRYLLAALKVDGALAIQVPDIDTQATDAYIIDHRHHFSSFSLSIALMKLGFHQRGSVEKIISGELTGVFERYSVKGVKLDRSIPVQVDGLNRFERLKNYLFSVEKCLFELKHSDEVFWVYGAGNLGVLVAGFLGDKVLGFIDDNHFFQGKERMGLPIYASSMLADRYSELIGRNIRTSSCQPKVIIAVPPAVAKGVEERCDSLSLSSFSPFKMDSHTTLSELG